MINNKTELLKLISYKRNEEEVRLGGIDRKIEIKDFRYFNEKLNEDVEEKFNLMQETYVFEDEYKIKFENVIASINELKIFLDS